MLVCEKISGKMYVHETPRLFPVLNRPGVQKVMLPETDPVCQHSALSSARAPSPFYLIYQFARLYTEQEVVLRDEK